MLPQTTEDVSTLLDALKNFGGWGVSLAMAYKGGTIFMALARDFKTEVVAELKAIKDALIKDESEIESLVHEVQTLRANTDEKLERLEHSSACKVSKP